MARVNAVLEAQRFAEGGRLLTLGMGTDSGIDDENSHDNDGTDNEGNDNDDDDNNNHIEEQALKIQDDYTL